MTISKIHFAIIALPRIIRDCTFFGVPDLRVSLAKQPKRSNGSPILVDRFCEEIH